MLDNLDLADGRDRDGYGAPQQQRYATRDSHGRPWRPTRAIGSMNAIGPHLVEVLLHRMHKARLGVTRRYHLARGDRRVGRRSRRR